jgi:NADH-quinone oxidoreductase subunit J
MEAVLFMLFGAIAVGASIMMVTRRHPLASVLYLILVLGAVAALFVLREAHFLAAIQVIVYAGAVIVLFVFAVMLTNVPYHRLPVESVTPIRILGVAFTGFLFIEAALIAGRFSMPKGSGPGGGTLEAVGQALFTDYLLAFEVTSVLLLAAVVGAIALARRSGRGNP